MGWIFVLLLVPSSGFAVYARARGDRRWRAGAIACAVLVVLGVILFHADLPMQKTVSYMIMPSGLLWLALGFMACDLLGRGVRRGGAMSAALFVAYGVLANQWVGCWLLRMLEARVPDEHVPASGAFDAVIVLGGGASFGPHGDAQLGDLGDRVVQAARMFHAGRTRLLVTSGSTITGIGEKQDLSLATAKIWRELGIPDDAIRRLPEPQNTSQEIAAFKALAEKEGWRDVGVLTSTWHLPRALATCRALGFDPTPIKSDRRGASPPWHPALLIPQAGALRAVQMAAWELVGMLVGR